MNCFRLLETFGNMVCIYTTVGYSWLQLVTIGYSWLQLGTVGYSWLQLGTVGYSWVQLGTVDYNWLQLGTVVQMLVCSADKTNNSNNTLAENTSSSQIQLVQSGIGIYQTVSGKRPAPWQNNKKQYI